MAQSRTIFFNKNKFANVRHVYNDRETGYFFGKVFERENQNVDVPPASRNITIHHSYEKKKFMLST